MGTAGLILSHREDWDPDEFGNGEAGIVEAIDFYQYDVCGKIFKTSGAQMDWFRVGNLVFVLLLWYGNFEVANAYHQKLVAAWAEVDLPTNRNFMDELHTINTLVGAGLSAHVMLGNNAKAADLLRVLGFTWDKDGFECFDQWFAELKAQIPFLDHSVYSAMIRIYMFLSFPKGVIDEAEFETWMPSPLELAGLERGLRWIQVFHCWDIVGNGAKAFLKLGRDDDAYKLCHIAVSSEQKTNKLSSQMLCHCILGQIEAKRGNVNEADCHFADTLNVAKLSHLPMLEVMAARDWKRHLLEPNGQDCRGAEAVIDGACRKMKKTRGQLGLILEGR